MRRNVSRDDLILVGVLISTAGVADEYDFEVGLAYDYTKFEGSQLITGAGGTIFSSSDIDTDDFSVFGSWYFAGLSDNKGPRARAAFVDRASSLVAGYRRSEQTWSLFRNSDDPTFPFSDLDSTLDSSGDSFAADIRYVDRASGWFGTAGLIDSDTRPRGIVDNSIGATGWSLGIGKYIYETTALSLTVSDIDSDVALFGTAVAANFSHLGNLGERWQYAVDLDYSHRNTDRGADLDTVGATLAFYPTRDIEFGISIVDEFSDRAGLIDLDTTSFQGFASWFVTPNVQLSARYRVDDGDYIPDVIRNEPTARDSDQDSFGISATVRF